MRNLIAFILLLLAPVVTACKVNLPLSGIDGDGRIASDSRTLPAFHELELEGSYDVELTQAASSSIRIEADSNLLEHITTEIRNGKLTVSSDKNLNPSKRIKVWISSPAYTSVEVDGSADVHAATPITGDALALSISGSGSYLAEVHEKDLKTNIDGSGKIQLTGEAQSHKSTISGSGDILAEALPTTTSNVTIEGSGNATVFVSDRLDADVAGSGDIRYKGRVTQVHTSVSGSGKVEKIGD